MADCSRRILNTQTWSLFLFIQFHASLSHMDLLIHSSTNLKGIHMDHSMHSGCQLFTNEFSPSHPEGKTCPSPPAPKRHFMIWYPSVSSGSLSLLLRRAFVPRTLSKLFTLPLPTQLHLSEVYAFVWLQFLLTSLPISLRFLIILQNSAQLQFTTTYPLLPISTCFFIFCKKL